MKTPAIEVMEGTSVVTVPMSSITSVRTEAEGGPGVATHSLQYRCGGKHASAALNDEDAADVLECFDVLATVGRPEVATADEEAEAGPKPIEGPHPGCSSSSLNG